MLLLYIINWLAGLWEFYSKINNGRKIPRYWLLGKSWRTNIFDNEIDDPFSDTGDACASSNDKKFIEEMGGENWEKQIVKIPCLRAQAIEKLQKKKSNIWRTFDNLALLNGIQNEPWK